MKSVEEILAEIDFRINETKKIHDSIDAGDPVRWELIRQIDRIKHLRDWITSDAGKKKSFTFDATTISTHADIDERPQLHSSVEPQLVSTGMTMLGLSNRRCSFSAPVPDDFAATLQSNMTIRVTIEQVTSDAGDGGEGDNE